MSKKVIIISSLLASFLFVVLYAQSATTISTNISTDGSLTVTGDVTFDTNTFYVDSTNNRVGIGTSTPGERLQISGNVIVGATFGSELAPAISDGNWTLATGWASPIVGGILNHNATGVGAASPAVGLSIVAGTTYKVVITTGNQMTSDMYWFLGGVAGTHLTTASTTYTDYITALTTDNLSFVPTVSSQYSKIASVSVIPLTSETGDLRAEGTLTTYRSATFGGSIYLSQGSVIYKDDAPFIHNFEVAETYGKNTFVGKNAGNLTLSTTGNVYDASLNVAVGVNALSSLTTGYYNVAIGASAMTSTAGTMASYNVAVGKSALQANVIGQDNVAIGAGALTLSASTGYNTSVGTYSLSKLTTGIGNTALGWFAGDGHDMVSTDERSTVDTYSMFLGYLATRDSSVPTATVLTNATAIGYMAKVGASNSMVLGGTGVYAVNVGIGTTSPWAKLSIHQNATDSGTILFAIASSTASATTTHMVVTNTGKVGIGTSSPATGLEVYGSSIKSFNIASSTCDDITRGAMFYNSDNDSFWGCKSSGWVRLDD